MGSSRLLVVVVVTVIGAGTVACKKPDDESASPAGSASAQVACARRHPRREVVSEGLPRRFASECGRKLNKGGAAERCCGLDNSPDVVATRIDDNTAHDGGSFCRICVTAIGGFAGHKVDPIAASYRLDLYARISPPTLPDEAVAVRAGQPDVTDEHVEVTHVDAVDLRERLVGRRCRRHPCAALLEEPAHHAAGVSVVLDEEHTLAREQGFRNEREPGSGEIVAALSCSLGVGVVRQSRQVDGERRAPALALAARRDRAAVELTVGGAAVSLGTDMCESRCSSRASRAACVRRV